MISHAHSQKQSHGSTEVLFLLFVICHTYLLLISRHNKATLPGLRPVNYRHNRLISSRVLKARQLPAKHAYPLPGLSHANPTALSRSTNAAMTRVQGTSDTLRLLTALGDEI
jgi:hypothetical protein